MPRPRRARRARSPRPWSPVAGGSRPSSTRPSVGSASRPEHVDRIASEVRTALPRRAVLLARLDATRAGWRERARAPRAVEPPPRGVGRAPLPPSRAAAARPDPGRQHRPHARGRKVRPSPRLPLLDVRDVVDPPGDHARTRRSGAHDPRARLPRRDAGRHHAGTRTLAQELGREPTPTEIANASSCPRTPCATSSASRGSPSRSRSRATMKVPPSPPRSRTRRARSPPSWRSRAASAARSIACSTRSPRARRRSCSSASASATRPSARSKRSAPACA